MLQMQYNRIFHSKKDLIKLPRNHKATEKND